ncbi:MAG: fluoride efflux transporter CrcB [Myxococcota bacterium]
MERFLWVCLAGGVGSGARYLIGLWASERYATTFPLGTLVVNLLGCFLMGFVAALALGLPSFPPTLRLALTTGFMGGLTTYSAFNFETTRILSDGATGTALLNVGVTLVGCFLTGLGGLALGRLIAPS